MARWQGAVVGVIGALSTDRLQHLATVKVEEPRTLAEDETRDSRRLARPDRGCRTLDISGRR